MRVPRLAAMTAAAVFSWSCGGSDDPSGPTTPTSATFNGVFASGVERGTITLVSGTPATGTLTVGNEPPVVLTGSFNAATSAFTLSGGGYSVNTTAGAGVIAGNVASSATLVARTGPLHGTGINAATGASANTMSGTITGPGITGTGTMAAVNNAATATTTRYCGIYWGDDSGMADVIVLGTSAVATVAGMGGGYTMSGTVSGSTITLSATGLEPGTNRTNTVTAIGTLSGGTLSGSGSSTLYPTHQTSVLLSSSGCAGAPTTGPYSSYVGLANNNGFSGLVTLTPGTPATGSIAWNNGAAVSLSGTYNAATGAFSVSGGGITINATASGSMLTGTATGSLSPLNTAGVTALGSSSATPVTRYCGPFTGGTTGKVIVMQGGSTLHGAVIYGNTSLVLGGTTGGSWVYMAGGANMFLAGSGTAASYAGTWSHVNNTAGTFTLTPC